jgi:hypothetical protein
MAACLQKSVCLGLDEGTAAQWHQSQPDDVLHQRLWQCDGNERWMKSLCNPQAI